MLMVKTNKFEELKNEILNLCTSNADCTGQKNGADCTGYTRHHSENKIREQALDFIFARGADCQA